MKKKGANVNSEIQSKGTIISAKMLISDGQMRI